MSNLAKNKADLIFSQYQTDDPYLIAEQEKIDIIEQPLAGRLKELFFGDYIILNSQLSHQQKRHLLAHALGHHFLHAGNYLFFQQHRLGQNDKEEKQADEFAAHLLLPDNKLSPIIHWDNHELADYFQVPPEFIDFRRQLFQNYR